MGSIEQICTDNQISLDVNDYEMAIRTARESHAEPYYGGAPVEEILRFASVSTKIALEILDLVETGEYIWASETSKYLAHQLEVIFYDS